MKDWHERALPNLKLILIYLPLLLGALFGLWGLLIYGWAVPVPMILFIIIVFGFNSILLFLGRFRMIEGAISWAIRLGNLIFLTVAVYFTGGFKSPLLALYAAYIVVGGLRSGWFGIVRSFVLCLLSWVVMAVLVPPTSLEEWAYLGVMISVFVGLSLMVGTLANRYVRFWQESSQRDREITFLQEAARLLPATLDPQQVLATTLGQVNELMEMEAASLALVDPETGLIRFELAIGGGDDDVKGLELAPGQGIVGEVIQEGQPVLVQDVTADSRWYNGVDQISGYRTRSILCVPLRVKGQTIGALEVLNKRDGPFTEEDQRLISSLAGLAAQAIENAQLHEESRQYAQRLEVAYDEVRKLDELKSAFIRNVSHELRTPLTLIEGYTELLLDGQMGELQPSQRQSLSVVAEKASSLHKMVNDIISLQTIGALGFDLESLYLSSLAQNAVAQMRSRAERAGIDLELISPGTEDLFPVRGDARRLDQVFSHLLDNAIKFSPSGGTIAVTLGREGEMVYARVSDEGIGLATDELERVFDRFYQVDGSSTRSYGGTGLGLALVKEVVEAHGGAVWAESVGLPGQGSTFTFFLPALDQTSEA